MKEKIIDLEKDIESYCGDWGTLEYGVEKTFQKILEVLKEQQEEIEKLKEITNK